MKLEHRALHTIFWSFVYMATHTHNDTEHLIYDNQWKTNEYFKDIFLCVIIMI